MNKLAILGASGHGKVVAESAERMGCWESITFFDDAWPLKSRLGLYEIQGDSERLFTQKDEFEVLVAVGDNQTRMKKYEQLSILCFEIATVVDPSAVISKSASIGVGSVVLPGSVINADARIGKGCIVNSNSVVEHDCILDDGCHISPSATLAGGVHVGALSWIGIGAKLIQQVSVGRNVVVGAGSVVIRNLEDDVTAVGVPTRVVSRDGALC